MSSQSSYENGRLVITRLFDAPRPEVFDAWINTSKVRLWWGCDFAIDVNSEIDPRIGGKFSHKITLKEVGNYHHHGTITEYQAPELLAYRLYDPFGNEDMMVRVEFSEDGNKTRVRLTQDNLPDAYSKFVIAGWTNGFKGLAQFLNQAPQIKENTTTLLSK